ncbi:hypothetical protein [Aureispira sp. CCB-E]|nr:hypothetical protein [Aureispira sp. CCB-E]WMX15727.1 hypothetical protein QP953_04940 [Aureispira sp. CCB-E]
MTGQIHNKNYVLQNASSFCEFDLKIMVINHFILETNNNYNFLA